jgi:hypothetical protein
MLVEIVPFVVREVMRPILVAYSTICTKFGWRLGSPPVKYAIKNLCFTINRSTFAASV